MSDSNSPATALAGTSAYRHRFRVRYAELDPQNVVFNSRYLEYADLLVTEYWRSIDLPLELEFHIARAEIDFRRPIRALEWIEGRVRPLSIGNSSMAMVVSLYGAEADGDVDDLRAEITLVHVHVDLATGESQRIPDTVRTLLIPEGVTQ